MWKWFLNLRVRAVVRFILYILSTCVVICLYNYKTGVLGFWEGSFLALCCASPVYIASYFLTIEPLVTYDIYP